MSALAITLLLVFQAKHWLADYPLQGRYMLGKFKAWPGCLGPLAAHASVHGVMTTAISLAVAPSLWWLGLVDALLHGVVDFVKANPRLGGRWSALSKAEMRNIMHYEENVRRDQFTRQMRSNTLFWWALGADQAAHHITHYALIWALLGTP